MPHPVTFCFGHGDFMETLAAMETFGRFTRMKKARHCELS